MRGTTRWCARREGRTRRASCRRASDARSATRHARAASSCLRIYCYDACPYEAIELTGEGANPHVSVLADKCNGCGACESVCVSLKAGSIVSGAQERAIVVKPIESTE